MKFKFTAFASLLVLAAFSSAQAAETVVLSVNAGDAPVTNATWNGNNGQYTTEEVGWLYTVPVTPSPVYTITDLGTEFGSSSNKLVTAEIFSGLPSSGGTLLASGKLTPVANTLSYATLGTPVILTAGSTYFIAFQNVVGLGRNVTTVAGATDLTPLYYDFGSSNGFGKSATNSAETHPIISFADNVNTLAVPEPSTWALLLSSFAGLMFFRRLRSQQKS